MDYLRYSEIAPGAALHAALIVGKGPGFQIREHGHDFYECVFVTQGEGLHGVNGAPESVLKAGSLALLTPSDRHWVRFAGNRPLHYFNVAFPEDAALDFFRAAGMQPPACQTASLAPALGAALFDRTLRASLAGGRADGRLTLCRFLAEMFALLEAEAAPASMAAPAWLPEVLREFDRSPEALLDGAGWLRARAGVGATHLARVMQQALGQTPTDYVNARRLERASYLLASTSWPVARIAVACGFSQQAYFCRLFRRRYGVPPRDWRRERRRVVAR